MKTYSQRKENIIRTLPSSSKHLKQESISEILQTYRKPIRAQNKESLQAKSSIIIQHNILQKPNSPVIQQRGDRYVTDANKYPHIHVNDDYITFSHSHYDHSYLIEGATVYHQRLEQIINQIIDGTIKIENNLSRKSILNFLRKMRKRNRQ